MKQFKQMVVQGERGQAIVLIALFMVVMLAMVGVAIDGGGLFWLWRNAQNAADTAALQAAYDKCTGGALTWQQEGSRAAEINGFVDQNIPGVNDVVVDMYTPPGESTAYVRVRIEATKPKYFIQLVYSGALQVTAQALVYCSEAVDFSTLPGMLGLGGCTCSGNSSWNNSVNFSGANFDVTGDVHSNCHLSINPGGGQNGGTLTGDASASDGLDYDDRTDVTGDEDPAAEEIEMPAEIPLNLYFPGGEIYDGILADQGANYVEHVVGDVSFTQDDYMEGLWAVEGDVTFSANLDGDFGPRGFTVVATGRITVSKFNYGDGEHLDNWYYYGHNASLDEGVTREWSRGNGSAIAMYSALDTREGCNNSDVGISLGNSNEPEVDWDIYGLIYGPRTVVDWSGNNIGVWGPVIAYRLSNSGSELLWRHNPSMLQPMAPVMNPAQ
jgi:hypothetical protein